MFKKKVRLGSGYNANALAIETRGRNQEKEIARCEYMGPKLFISLMAMLLFFNISGYSSAAEKKINSWITKKEASLPPMKHPKRENKNSDKLKNQPFSVNKQSITGPIIKIKKPDPDKLYKDLIDILIHFEKNPMGESVDMASLRIIYLKMFGIDITDRILPYIKETRIDANGIKFPEGEHEFEIRIKDKEGMASAQIFKINLN
jgi:hypothetical protein